MMKTIGLIVAAVAVIGTLWYALGRPAIGWPDESRRVRHPAGFSIVAPEGWERHVSFASERRGSDSLSFLPSKVVGSPGTFSVRHVPGAISEVERASRYEAVQFAGKPAWARAAEHTLTHEHSRSVIFEREGKWFEVTLRRPSVEALDIGIWRAYAETFRLEPVTTLSTSMPSTLPVVLP